MAVKSTVDPLKIVCIQCHLRQKKEREEQERRRKQESEEWEHLHFDEFKEEIEKHSGATPDKTEHDIPTNGNAKANFERSAQTDFIDKFLENDPCYR